MGYRNPIATEIGLDVVPDPNTGDSTISKFYIPTFFERFYTTGKDEMHVVLLFIFSFLDCVISCVMKALNDQPRKLHYNSIVSYLQYNRPEMFKSDPEEFLYNCFDVAGNFSVRSVLWMLFKMNVVEIAPNQSLDELLLFPQLDVDSIRASRDRIMSSQNIDNTSLSKSRTQIDIDEIRSSIEAAAQHVCKDHIHE
jgi:hypothetical protein